MQACAFIDFHLRNGKQIYPFSFKRIAVCVRVKRNMQCFEELCSLSTYFSVCMLGWVCSCQLCCRRRFLLINQFIASKPKYSICHWSAKGKYAGFSPWKQSSKGPLGLKTWCILSTSIVNLIAKAVV